MSSDRVFRPNEEQLELLKRWYAPDVTKAVNQQATNAFGMTAKDMVQAQAETKTKVEPELEEPPQQQEPAQLTAQDLEEIRLSAQQEGHDQGFSKGQAEGILAGHDEGYQQGLEQGKIEGHQQGYETGKAEIDAQLALLAQLVAQFEAPLADQEQQLEQALVELALDVAKKVIHTEVSQSHQPMVQAITDGVRLLGRHEPVTVRLHPQDLETISTIWPQDELIKRNMMLESDLTLTVGSCAIESKLSMVTLDLPARIEQVFNDFYARPAPASSQELADESTTSNDLGSEH